MKFVCFFVLRALVLVALITMYLYLGYGQERPRRVPITRNVAWNDLVDQIDLEQQYPRRETLGTDFVLIQRFLHEHQSEISVESYNLRTLRAIDMARARLQKADKDLQVIRNDLSHKSFRASVEW